MIRDWHNERRIMLDKASDIERALIPFVLGSSTGTVFEQKVETG